MPATAARQRLPWSTGAALPVGLLLLMGATLIGLAGARLSQLELLISVNDERSVHARQQSQSLVDSVLMELGSVPPLAPGQQHCLRASAGAASVPACAAEGAPALPLVRWPDPGAGVAYALVGREPPSVSPPPPASGFSAIRFGAVAFSVTGVFDGSAHGLGRSGTQERLSFLTPLPVGVAVIHDEIR